MEEAFKEVFINNIIAHQDQQQNPEQLSQRSDESEVESLTMQILRQLPKFVMKDFLNLYTTRLLEYNSSLLELNSLLFKLQDMFNFIKQERQPFSKLFNIDSMYSGNNILEITLVYVQMHSWMRIYTNTTDR